MTVSGEPIKKSKKRILELSEIVRPYVLTPSRDITGGVNRISYFFPRGKPSELTLSQYEVLVNSSYADQLSER